MLHRRPLVKMILEGRPANSLAVSGLGSSTWDVTASGEDARNFRFIGAMGQAGAFALGLAMAQPEKRVVLFTGDGEMLMGLGVLATIANQAPSNLAILVLDNESYVETGNQPTATAGPTDLEAVARGCGISNTCTIRNDSEVDILMDMIFNLPGPIFVNAKVVTEKLPLVLPDSFDGVTAINQFRGAVIE